MNKYKTLSLILYLQGCYLTSDFDRYYFSPNIVLDSSIALDSSLPDSGITSDSSLPDSGIADSAISDNFFDFIVDGQVVSKEISICKVCETNRDCVSGEECYLRYNVCILGCGDEICNFGVNENGLMCQSGTICLPIVSCDQWRIAHYGN